MNVIEAMARAIDSGAWMPSYVGDGTRRDMALVKARNALIALRDVGVTEGMNYAANLAEAPKNWTTQTIRQAQFRAMLDAALEEG